tara:strand:- start:3013 stop:3657 length:645 start_codon:yes stop_codon:yes gene_type:complete
MVYKLPKEAIADNELEASQLSSNLVNSFVPIGGIIMWSGTVAEAEALTNWKICDGQNGTPDLRDKFVLGVGSSAAASTANKGDTNNSNTIQLSEGQMPAHNHNITDNGHNHGDGTLAAANQSITGEITKISEGFNAAGTATGVFSKTNNGNNSITESASTSPVSGFTMDASHGHDVTGSTSNNTTGITAQVQGNGDAIDIRSAYLALCYIIRVT